MAIYTVYYTKTTARGIHRIKVREYSRYSVIEYLKVTENLNKVIRISNNRATVCP